MGDDLTFDQLWVAGDEDEVQGAVELGDFDEDAVILENPNEEMSKPQKRKLGAGQSAVAPSRPKHAPKHRTVPLTEEQMERKRQKVEKLKRKKQQGGDGGGGAKGADAGGQAANMLQVLQEPAAKQAEYFWSEYCSCVGGDLSLFEIQDCLPAAGVESLGNLARHPENITQCIEKLYPKHMSKFKKWSNKNPPGSPIVVIVCMSAARCAVLLKHLAKYKKLVAKLFAKHTKLKDQIVTLAEQKVAMAVGTPHRIAALLSAGVLKLTHTTHIVVDCTYRDAKNRSVFDEQSVRRDLMQLYRNHVHKLAKRTEKPLKLVLF